MPDLADVLVRLAAGEIDLAQANELLFIAPLDPASTCATCMHIHGWTCERPGQPSQPMHPQSVRCAAYNRRDERMEALPYEPPRQRPMFK